MLVTLNFYDKGLVPKKQTHDGNFNLFITNSDNLFSIMNTDTNFILPKDHCTLNDASDRLLQKGNEE
jgi:hypothetical protein